MDRLQLYYRYHSTQCGQWSQPLHKVRVLWVAAPGEQRQEWQTWDQNLPTDNSTLQSIIPADWTQQWLVSPLLLLYITFLAASTSTSPVCEARWAEVSINNDWTLGSGSGPGLTCAVSDGAHFKLSNVWACCLLSKCEHGQNCCKHLY